MPRRSVWRRAGVIALAAVLVGAACTRAPGGAAPAAPWEISAGTWRDDHAWFDGRAEVARYRATATIYDRTRHYTATLYTNSEHVDPSTTVKVEGEGGLAMFKHHLRERIPTENYDYEYSTTSWITRDALGSFKSTVSTQEDCGASFKQVVFSPRGYTVYESVYYPGPAPFTARIGSAPLVFEDALTLVLRDVPETVPADGLPLDVLESQRSTRRVEFRRVRMMVRDGGVEVVDAPIGPVPARRIDLVLAGGERRATYWFAREKASPWLGALVRYEGPGGRTLELESLVRDAYWLREG